MNHLRIDLDKCVGCGKCARICLKDNIVVENRKAKEVGNDCLECGHCVSTCPKGAIQLIQSEKSSGAFSSVKKDKMFDGGLISDEDLTKLLTMMDRGYAKGRCQFFILQGDLLDSFMETLWEIVNEKESDTAIVREWAEWRQNHGSMDTHPILSAGRQILFIFADSPDTAFSSSRRMMLAGLDLRITGFHSNIIMAASKWDKRRIMSYFPDAKKELYMAYVIGHPRRMVEPVFKPMKKIKGLFDRL